MIKKILFSSAGLAAAGLLPFLYFSVNHYWTGGSKPPSPPASTYAYATMSPSGLPTPAATGPQSPGAPPMALEGTPARDLGEIINFQVTPDWVIRRWPRVSTGLAQLQLHGYRVPLMTGTKDSDLAGALTYYFNPRQQVERITFRGSTGDPRNLVGLATGRYRLARRLTNDPSLMVYEGTRSSGKPGGTLWVRATPVLKAEESHRRYEVELVIERPES